jgi:hypothetical protein
VAVEEARKKGVTGNPLLGAIYLSEYINRRNGGILVTPSTVYDLPDDLLDAYRALQRSEPRSAPTRNGPFEHFFKAFRQKHPTFRKYH